MLLIAQPKSASTSLLITLADMMGIKAFRGTKRKDFHILHDEFIELQRYHTLIFERSPLDIMKMVKDKNLLYREHLLPCRRNFKILDKYNNFIVLLRDPEDSYDNYKRILEKNNKENKELLSELTMFYVRYEGYLDRRKDILCIYYKDLILDYNKTMKKIKAYWKIKGRIKKLKKENYTGVGISRLKKR
jgi:hypothetical protein